MHRAEGVGDHRRVNRGVLQRQALRWRTPDLDWDLGHPLLRLAKLQEWLAWINADHARDLGRIVERQGQTWTEPDLQHRARCTRHDLFALGADVGHRA